MKVNTLVFGDGLLGSAFKHFESIVLSHAQCDITQKDQLKSAISYYNPRVVVNAAGIVPKNSAGVETTFKVNSFAPHYIADVCYKKCQFVHISTDCVFSGEKGNYTERDVPDASDIYGMSKLFGEPLNALVIRASFVGLPDPKGRGLLAWASQQEELVGYDKVFWNGVTPFELIRVLNQLVSEGITGVRHVYSYTLSKYELLKCAKELFGWTMPLYKESDTHASPHECNKTLGSLYATGFVAKPIRRQLKELVHVQK